MSRNAGWLLMVYWVGALAQENAGSLERKHCSACHGEAFYQRTERRLQESGELLERVKACNQNLGIGLLPGEERQLAEYLYRRHYRSGP